MKIKTKLTLGVGLLFMLIVLQILVGAKYISALKEDTENILIDNYNSLEYTRNMLNTIDEETPDAFKNFESNLNKQLVNTTEIGEKEVTTELANNFKNIQKQKRCHTVTFNEEGNLYHNGFEYASHSAEKRPCKKYVQNSIFLYYGYGRFVFFNCICTPCKFTGQHSQSYKRIDKQYKANCR